MQVVQVMNLVGQSRQSFTAAAEAAVAEAAQTIRNIRSVQVEKLSGEVINGRIANYRASVQVAFMAERPDKPSEMPV